MTWSVQASVKRENHETQQSDLASVFFYGRLGFPLVTLLQSALHWGHWNYTCPKLRRLLQPVSLIKHTAWRTCPTSLATAIKHSGQAHLPNFRGGIKAPHLFLIKPKARSDHWTTGWDLPRLPWPLTLPSLLHKLSLKTDLTLHWWLLLRHPSWRLSEMGNPKVPLAADPWLVKN